MPPNLVTCHMCMKPYGVIIYRRSKQVILVCNLITLPVHTLKPFNANSSLNEHFVLFSVNIVEYCEMSSMLSYYCCCIPTIIAKPFCVCSDALGRAKLLLKMPHSHARLEHVWGAGGGQQPMPQLVEQVRPFSLD